MSLYHDPERCIIWGIVNLEKLGSPLDIVEDEYHCPACFRIWGDELSDTSTDKPTWDDKQAAMIAYEVGLSVEFLHPEHGWTLAQRNTRLDSAKLYARSARDNWKLPTRVQDESGAVLAVYRRVHP